MPEYPEAADHFQEEARLREAIAAANIPTLLMVVVQLTGELRWLDEPYRPTPPRGLDDNDSGGLAHAQQAEVRTAATRAIRDWLGGKPIAIPDPSEDLLVKMLSTSVGEPVPSEYGPMMAAEIAASINTNEREQSTPARPGTTTAWDHPSDMDALIIGAGVSGLCAAVRLQEAGIEYTIVERNGGIGGTWLENRYPAAAVDTPSHLYSFSFASHDWPRYFASQEQIHTYLENVATDHGIWPRICFRTEVMSACYEEHAQSWAVTVRCADGSVRTLRARIVISAVGAFNPPKVPRLPGLDDFAGPAFHTARWPERLDLTGKHVAVIGNGASAMQVVPAIAPEVESLTVFQRSKHWVAPFDKFQLPVPDALRHLLATVPLYHVWYRLRLGWVFNDKLHASLQKDPAWPYPDRSLNAANDKFREFLTRYVTAELGERQDLLPSVLPTYPPCGKRLLLDNGWYRTLCRPNVELVTESINQVRSDRVVTHDGAEYQADVLVFATGFEVSRFLSTFDAYGRSGQALSEVWRDDDARAYLGLAVPGFPNFFILYGPNTQTGHGGSLIALVEGQMNYVISLLDRMRAERAGAVEVKTSVHDSYNDRVDEAHRNMVWTHPGMDTYYRNSQGRVVVNTPFRVVDFWHMTRRAEFADYHVEPMRDH